MIWLEIGVTWLVLSFIIAPAVGGFLRSRYESPDTQRPDEG